MLLKRLRLPAVLTVATLLLGVAARTTAVTHQDLRGDEAVQALRTPVLTVVADILNVAFGPVGGVLIILLLGVTLALRGRARTAVLVTLMITTGWATSTIFKQIIARPRPPVADQLILQLGHDSFPSGHVTLTLSLAVGAGFLAAGTRRFRLVACVGAVLVAAQAIARMYLGVHYPTDVIGSLLAGTAGTSAVIALRGRIDQLLRRPMGGDEQEDRQADGDRSVPFEVSRVVRPR